MRKALELAAVVAAAAAAAAPAAHASAISVIRDCSEDGVLDGRYSQGDLKKALDNLPADQDEYSDCHAEIRHAQLAGGRGGGGADSILALAGGPPPSPREQKQIDEAISSGDAPIDIAGKTIKPGATGAPFSAAGLGTDLPPLVLAVLVGLSAAMLAGAGFSVKRRWPGAWRVTGVAAARPFRRLGRGARRGVSRFRR